MTDLVTFRETNFTLPALAEYLIVFDTTRSLNTRVANSATLVSTAGSDRGMFADCRFKCSVQAVTQDVTIVFQIWSGNAWTTIPAGSDTLTAGTIYPYDWLPGANEWRVYILAGATAPSALYIEGSITKGDRASG